MPNQCNLFNENGRCLDASRAKENLAIFTRSKIIHFYHKYFYLRLCNLVGLLACWSVRIMLLKVCNSTSNILCLAYFQRFFKSTFYRRIIVLDLNIYTFVYYYVLCIPNLYSIIRNMYRVCPKFKTLCLEILVTSLVTNNDIT